MPQFPRPADPPRNELAIFTRKVGIVAMIIAVAALLWYARAIVLLVFIAAVLAAGISPLVRSVRVRWRYNFHRNLPRGPAVMIVYLPFLISVVLIGILLVPRVVADARELGQQLPTLIEQNILRPIERYVPVGAVRAELASGIELPRSRVFAYMRSAAAAIGSIGAVLFMIAYMLIDADRLRNLFLLVYAPEVRGEKRRMLGRMSKKMSSWLSGQILLSTIIGVSTFAGLMIIGVPYALPLAIIAAVGELIPVAGPTLSAIPALAVALLHSPWQFWAVLIFYVVLQKAENLFIVPRVMSRKVSVSPLAVFIAFMIGGTVLGLVGAIIAIPVVAIAQVAFDEAFVSRRERRQDVERAGTLLRKAD